MSGADGAMVDIGAMPVDQLQHVQKKMAEEVQFMNSSFGSLKLALNRYSQSQECVSEMGSTSKKSKILVPLTSSLYVPGELEDVSSVLVELGTGYFVEKDVAAASAFLNAKVDMLKKNSEQVIRHLQSKQSDLQAVEHVLQAKVQAAQQEQAAK